MNELKIRLAMSLMPDATTGVVLGEVWDRLHEAEPDLAAMAQRLGWSLEHAAAIETYRNSPGRYHFASEAEVLHLFEQQDGLRLIERYEPSYSLGDRFPTLVFERTAP